MVTPTDTRLRPDQRAMEDGRYDEAGDEKFRVEEKQRAARRKREENNLEYHPQWFVRILIPSQKLNIGDIRANIGLKEEIMI